MKTMDKVMSVNLQDILLSVGYEPNKFNYIKSNADDIVFREIKTNKLLYIRY